MKYMGSKTRISKKILPIILENRNDELYIEPFSGGCNILQFVDGARIANDIHPYLNDMWRALIKGWEPPEYISKELYLEIKNNKEAYPKELVGWVGFNCSYSGKYFGGYAGITQTREGERNYQTEARKNISRQIPSLKGVTFSDKNYLDLDIPKNSIVYCDPPYQGVTEYSMSFDHNIFWDWVRELSKNNRVYVSEYKAPSDFKCIWSQELNSSLSANGISGGNKKSIEKLFILEK